jgi:hypothetical protein
VGRNCSAYRPAMVGVAVGEIGPGALFIEVLLDPVL